MVLSGIASAPGKIIITGEHAVVHGKPVLAMAINKRLKCHFKATKSQSSHLLISIDGKLVFSTADDVNSDASDKENEVALISHIINDLKCESTVAGIVEVTVESEIPQGAGMGSSAAYSCALSAALLHSIAFLVDFEVPKQGTEELKDYVWSYTNFLEKKFHGRPSGCDAATVVDGGVVVYVKATPPEVTEIRQLTQCKINKTNLIVVDTNKRREAKALVSRVTKLKEDNPNDFNELINTIGDVSTEVIELLQERVLDKYAFWDYISMN